MHDYHRATTVHTNNDTGTSRGQARMKRQFTASVWREDDWYVAQCLEVDVASQGDTEAEALENLREALELYFEPPTPTVAPRMSWISPSMTYFYASA
jgi:hypothetical protein